MKVGNSGNNGFNLDKNNIIKTTFDILMEEGRKTLEAYRVDLEELFYSRYKMRWQRAILKDAAPIIICKAEVTPDVRPNPPLSLDNVQSMINYALERQVKSSNELMRKLIEERDKKKLIDSNVHLSSSSYAFNFAQTNPHPSGTSAGGTSQPNPSAQSINHFYSQTTIDGSAPTGGMSQQTTTSIFG
jgi:hypothetical protein